jgi:hypothetical protein
MQSMYYRKSRSWRYKLIRLLLPKKDIGYCVEVCETVLYKDPRPHSLHCAVIDSLRYFSMLLGTTERPFEFNGGWRDYINSLEVGPHENADKDN